MIVLIGKLILIGIVSILNYSITFNVIAVLLFSSYREEKTKMSFDYSNRYN